MKAVGSLIQLERGSFKMVIDAERGGSVLAFDYTPPGKGAAEALPLLRPFDPQDPITPSALATGCFPLLPYSNRIFEGAFEFNGLKVELPPNMGDHPHNLHGVGWTSSWQPRRVTASGAIIDLHYRPTIDDLETLRQSARPAAQWPWAFDAEQRFQLKDEGVEMRVAITNRSSEVMPAGVGFHPYFPLFPDTHLVTESEVVWMADEECIPLEPIDVPPKWDFSESKPVAPTDLDHCFGCWCRGAQLMWQNRGLGLTIAATKPLNNLLIFHPPGGDFICLEPVSHMPNAINMELDELKGLPDQMMEPLEPGQTLAGHISLKLFTLDPD